MVEKKFVFPFEKLEVYYLAIDLADAIFDLLDRLPSNRHLRMIGQMEAAVSSIAQNIAEGKGRQYKKEFAQFLYISEGSLFEVLALCELFRRRKLFSEADVARIRGMAENLDRKLRGLINSLRGRPGGP
jgi:four helix bundle protein